MTTSTTDADAEAIARIIEDEIDRAANHYFTGGFTERASQIKNVASDTATAILSYLALRREAQEPVAGELLPCPFCGGAAETDSQQAYRNISTGRTETAVAVYCTSCGAQHTICRGDVPDAELSDVTELWNKRAAPPSPVPAPAGEVERLALEPILSFLDELAANGQPGQRKALNPVLIGGSAKLYAEALRTAFNGGQNQ